jgi:hypothetical protein
MASPRKNGRLGDPALPSLSLNSEVEQVVLLLILVLENSRYLTVTLIERSSADDSGLARFLATTDLSATRTDPVCSSRNSS